MSSKYSMHLSFNGSKEKITLPVLPSEFSVKYSSKLQTMDIVQLGEVVTSSTESAATISFSSFFPVTAFPGIKVKNTPRSLVNKIRKWKASNKPVRLVVSGCGINMYCMIDSFTVTEKGGDVCTIYYSLALKEYKEIKVRKLKTKITINAQTVAVGTKTNRVDNTVGSVTYVVKDNDSLYSIAYYQLGDGQRYKELYEYNKSTIDAANKSEKGSKYTIHTGQVLAIP